MKNNMAVTQFKKKGITNPLLLKAFQDIPISFLTPKESLPFSNQETGTKGKAFFER